MVEKPPGAWAGRPLTPEQLRMFSRSLQGRTCTPVPPKGPGAGKRHQGEVPVLFQVVQLPGQHHICRVKSLNKGDANSEVTVYYQMHMEEPCFDFLRTKETLGTETVELKIEEFLASFEKKLSALSENAFSTQISALKKMTREDLVSWYQEHRGRDRPKLSVHVVGFGAQEDDQPTEVQGGEEDDLCSSSYGEVSKLTFLPATPKMAAATAIMDIPAFTKDLPLFPYHKILQ
ncbi:hypothetical protein CRUP_011915 [Coryphaenoides rupestris]|nr:hypothetical protein CRUP_011915 [Coryphaenoides rupestris]